MPSTDIDGTPLFILGADDAISLLEALRSGEPWAKEAKLKQFCEDPQVAEWFRGAGGATAAICVL